jgi:hypothetical protein
MKQRPKAALSLLLLGILGASTLAGCGIKPGQVAAPSGEENDQFPHEYPDAVYDPGHSQY